MKFTVNSHLFPFKSRFITLESGHHIHFIDEGEGPVLLMLHGNPTWSFLYRKMISELKADFRCIAPDLPGFGLSEAVEGFNFSAASHYQVLEQFLETLDPKSFILVAQDWGGPLGLRLAEKFPHKIKGAILGNTWAWPLKGNFRYEMFSRINGGALGRWMASAFNGVWKVFMSRGFYFNLSKDEMEMFRAPFALKKNRIQTSVFPRELIRAFEFEQVLEKDLKIIQHIPVLFSWGTKDFAFQSDALKRFQLYFSNHKTVLLEAGHFWQYDQGEQAAEAIREWVKEKFQGSGDFLGENNTRGKSALSSEGPGEGK